jgi:hypothetical protein
MKARGAACGARGPSSRSWFTQRALLLSGNRCYAWAGRAFRWAHVLVAVRACAM